MKQFILSRFDMPWISVLALLIFMFLFISVIFWLFRKDSNDIYSEAVKVPFNEGEFHEN